MRVLLVMFVLSLGLAACGDDDYGQDLAGHADLSGSVVDGGKD